MQSEVPPSIKLFVLTVLGTTQQQSGKEAILCQETPSCSTMVERMQMQGCEGPDCYGITYLILSL